LFFFFVCSLFFCFFVGCCFFGFFFFVFPCVFCFFLLLLLFFGRFGSFFCFFVEDVSFLWFFFPRGCRVSFCVGGWCLWVGVVVGGRVGGRQQIATGTSLCRCSEARRAKRSRCQRSLANDPLCMDSTALGPGGDSARGRRANLVLTNGPAGFPTSVPQILTARIRLYVAKIRRRELTSGDRCARRPSR